MILIHLSSICYLFVLNLSMSLYRKIKKSILVVLLWAICLVFYNQAANWHYHMLNNGMIIEHSHPYDKQNDSGASFPNHNHSESFLLFFDMISNFFVILIAAIGVQQVFRNFTFTPVPFFKPRVISIDYRHIKIPRAPPFLSY